MVRGSTGPARVDGRRRDAAGPHRTRASFTACSHPAIRRAIFSHPQTPREYAFASQSETRGGEKHQGPGLICLELRHDDALQLFDGIELPLSERRFPCSLTRH